MNTNTRWQCMVHYILLKLWRIILGMKTAKTSFFPNPGIIRRSGFRQRLSPKIHRVAEIMRFFVSASSFSIIQSPITSYANFSKVQISGIIRLHKRIPNKVSCDVCVTRRRFCFNLALKLSGIKYQKKGASSWGLDIADHL